MVIVLRQDSNPVIGTIHNRKQTSREVIITHLKNLLLHTECHSSMQSGISSVCFRQIIVRAGRRIDTQRSDS